MKTYSGKFNLIELEKYKAIFISIGAKFSMPQYMAFQARTDSLTASFYNSGKFVIQGAKCLEFCEKYLNVKCESQPAQTPKGEDFVPFPHIGIDESGKGDFFGPLVIAGVLLDDMGAKKCLELGVCDSKKLDDKKILSLAPQIKAISTYDVIVIGNKKYNELYLKFKNLNKMLAWGHATILENILMKKPCEIAISDKFADESVIINALKTKGKNVKLIQKTKAEADVAVAAASILARAEFVIRISKLSAQYEINLPKGASSAVLAQGKKFIKKFGENEMHNVSKVHFKTFIECKKG